MQKLICPICGKRLSGSAPGGKKTKYIYYKCLDCNEYINEEIIEKQLLNLLDNLFEYHSALEGYLMPIIKSNNTEEIEIIKKS